MQEERSVQSTRSDIFSAPMTSACCAAPARIVWSAVASAVQKPAQALLRSKTTADGIDRCAATLAAVEGERSIGEQVATMTCPMSDGASPEAASAFAPAAEAMSATVSFSAAMRRVAMPVRWRIHSSLVSTIFSRSALVSTRSGW